MNATVGGLGIIQLQGSQNGKTIVLTLYNIDSLGSYDLGVAGTTVGGSGQYTDLTGRGWATPLSGLAGTITLTALTSTRIAGTFAFSADSILGAAHGTTAVTQGQFDLPLGGTLATIPDKYGSRLSGTIGAAPYNGATVVMALSGTTLVIGASTTSYSVSIGKTSFAGVGAYTITGQPGDPVVVVSGPYTNPNGSVNCCWGGGTGNTGTLTITGVTATRIKGTVVATLVPSPATSAAAPLSISTAFDVGIP
jgi:hypothetical protein